MRGAKEALLIFLRGFLMGLADTIPGVSGGTIAFITGIYDRLVSAIAEITLIGTDILKGRWHGFKAVLKRVDFSLFIPLGLGIGLAIFFFSRLMSFLLKEHAAATFAFFFGLILASAIVIFRKVGSLSPGNFVAGFVGFIFSFSLIGLGVTDALGHSLPVIFASGAIAICAMILPGISGAFILLLLGQYEFLIDALHSFNVLVIVSAGAGAAIGILAFSGVLRFLLRAYHEITLSFLAGLMLGSLRMSVEEMGVSYVSVLPLILFGVFGFVLVLAMEFSFRKK